MMKILDDADASGHRRRRNGTKTRLDTLSEALDLDRNKPLKGDKLETEFMTQINVFDSRIPRDSARTSFRDDMPFINDVTTITNTKGFPYAVIGDQYADALVSQKRNNTPNSIHRNGIYARKRFIQQNELRSRCQSASNL